MNIHDYNTVRYAQDVKQPGINNYVYGYNQESRSILASQILKAVEVGVVSREEARGILAKLFKDLM